MTATEVIFIADAPRLVRQAVTGLESGFRTRRDGGSRGRRTYYDTFDWRLYRHGGALAADARDESWMLRWLRADGSTRHLSQTEASPGFAWNLDAEGFHQDLAGVIDVRRLLPVAHVDVRSETLAILDQREKTVARVHVERGTAAPGDEPSSARPMAERLRVAPVLGYDGDHAAIVRYLGEQSDLRRHEGGELLLALAAIGADPGSYSSKLDVPLDPRMRAAAAAGRILKALLRTMRANEDGTRRDLDSEFLHDFRVAVRRTRSCLGQVKGVFDKTATEPFRRELAWLGAVTGPTRDLDVYLLNMREYRRELPPSLASDLDALENYLRKRQKLEQRRVSRALASQRYANFVRDWSGFLDGLSSDDPSGAPDAARSVRDVAVQQIRRAFRRVRKHGGDLDAGTPPEVVHRLRIDCKKLRYLLEFFRNVFEAQRVAPLVQALKRLQDHLGEFNDLDVQQRELRAMAAEMHEQGVGNADAVLAMGCLIGRLEQRQTDLKRRLVESVRSFVGKQNRTGFRELLR
jgi:CHAD domain-containing protein